MCVHRSPLPAVTTLKYNCYPLLSSDGVTINLLKSENKSCSNQIGELKQAYAGSKNQHYKLANAANGMKRFLTSQLSCQICLINSNQIGTTLLRRPKQIGTTLIKRPNQIGTPLLIRPN